ncbi:hypothetical protein ACRN94_01365 [Shewanella baltica]|jgi:hypothetical protein|uniref:hypothetical protein n=1 Tax=Shewanella TaxID=22 RepID=UPI00217EE7DA|nr:MULTISPECIES: hypothetical protein [Shewanella]MCS6205268.1 hypothetical protein [Shewanella baltica]MCU8007208.1 hypothetical protein [Shewanella sp. SM87]
MPQGIRVFAKRFLDENYDCAEYLSRYEGGHYDEQSFLQLVLPLTDVTISNEHQHLVIGHAGADGIEFCYRIHKPGVWAFYPIEGRFQKVATNIGQLVEGWSNGTIKV